MGAQEQAQPQGWAHIGRAGGADVKRFDLGPDLRTVGDLLRAAEMRVEHGETVNVNGQNVPVDQLDKVQLEPNSAVSLTSRIANGL